MVAVIAGWLSTRALCAKMEALRAELRTPRPQMAKHDAGTEPCMIRRRFWLHGLKIKP